MFFFLEKLLISCRVYHKLNKGDLLDLEDFLDY